MKATAAMFKDKTLEVFGLKTAKIVDIMPTVLPVVEAKEKRVDFVFLLEDDATESPTSFSRAWTEMQNIIE